MSLTSLIDDNPSVRNMVPNLKADLVSLDGVSLTPSVWRTPIKFPRLGKSFEAGTIGTAFDYVARSILTRKVGRAHVQEREPIAVEGLHKLLTSEAPSASLIREKDPSIADERITGLELARQHFDECSVYLNGRLDEALFVQQQFVEGLASLEDLGLHTVFLARLDEW